MVNSGSGANRIGAFQSCGAGYWVLRKRSDPREVKFVADHCHDRFCETCGFLRQAVIRQNLKTQIADRPHRLLTLTIRADQEPLTDLIDKLLKCFRRLRARVFWREKVRGGAAFVEVSADPETHRWHPHLHVILDGKFLEQARLRALWLAITGDSFVVDVRLIRNASETIDYVTKYATKPLSSKIVNCAPLLEEAIEALRGRKLCYAFGTWSKWRLLKPIEDEEWETVCHANEIPFRSLETDDYYDQIATHLRRVIDRGEDSTFTTLCDP